MVLIVLLVICLVRFILVFLMGMLFLLMIVFYVECLVIILIMSFFGLWFLVGVVMLIVVVVKFCFFVVSVSFLIILSGESLKWLLCFVWLKCMWLCLN